jgi:hypothetical protein
MTPDGGHYSDLEYSSRFEDYTLDDPSTIIDFLPFDPKKDFCRGRKPPDIKLSIPDGLKAPIVRPKTDDYFLVMALLDF